ncbi:HNH endonuclease family protein [Aliiglaciecola sp. CAU 1673]|uniref:HNH endonuclease family protein n=1 Tax=Aliiglaciecola sp. CAU 1673 TaxID=3032595 RepID=UPI0023DAC0D7|nr:HNH endonuclease family protein [Aliiglaciecola sp. CAU 1673]MDF2180128.1 HNH endonuclease family protein [Aliiglaciecola sp. CAU 1673]
MFQSGRLFVGLWFFLAFAVIAQEPVKLSRSGICHTPQSHSYERTKHFTPHASLEACIEAGGRLPKGAGHSQAPQPNAHKGYDRDEWPHWDDSDGDCQNTRAEALILASMLAVAFEDKPGDRADTCRVIAGTWLDPFSGKSISKAEDLDVDHIVPLKWANDRGGAVWPKARKRDFANDYDNLLVVDNSLNRAKGHKAPNEWLPPNQAFHCEYIQRFDAIVQKYQLAYQAHEQHFVQDKLTACAAGLSNVGVSP